MTGASIGSALGGIARGFLKWYWKLPVAGMVIATVAIVIAANYLLASLGLSSASRWEVTTVLGMGLLLTVVAACFWRALTGDPNKR
jgi:hypothetical protein